MKRFIAIILALVCLLAMVGCDTDPTNDPDAGSDFSGNNPNQSQGSITPGGDGVLNEDGTLNIPSPETGADCEVSNDTWTSLLSDDALRAAMKDNSITTITSSGNADKYQMFFCAGGRYGCILHGNYHSETICCVEDEKVYLYNRSDDDGPWTREVSKQSYDEYITNHYIIGPMQFLSGIASVYGNAQYVESEKGYVIENFVISQFSDENLIGTLKVQFVNEKIYSISLTTTVEGETSTLCTLFGSVTTPEIPTDFTEGNSSSSSDHSDHHKEPPEASCSEQRWQRLFGEERLLDNLMDRDSSITISNGQQEYLYKMSMHLSRLVTSANGNYEEILINREERFQRNSQDGQWMRYAGRNHRHGYETILNEKTAVLTQLLIPLKDLYNQTSFDSASHCFSLSDVTFVHGTFGSVTAEYAIIIQGGMIEQIKATIQSADHTWTLLMEHDKDNMIEPPTDYVNVDDGESGKK